MKKIGVVGAGTMGAGIVQTLAEKGFEVLVYESYEPARESAQEKVEKFIRKAAEKGKVSSEQSEQSIHRIHWCHDIRELRDSEFVI